jgi:hypothetical protein
MLAGLDVAGMVVTVDALRTQRDAVRPIIPGRRPLPDDRQWQTAVRSRIAVDPG